MKFEGFLRQVGKNIREARLQRGLKQIDVHTATGLTYRHYQSIEAGKVNVTLETLFRLASLYSIPVDALLKDPSGDSKFSAIGK